MKKIKLILLVISFLPYNLFASEIDSAYIYNTYNTIAKRIIEQTMNDSLAWNTLAFFCDTFGPRFSGSKSLNDALFWAKDALEKDGFENVRLEKVMVPNWKRNSEEAYVTYPRIKKMNISALGGSVGTNGKFIEAPVLVVSSFEELKEKAALVPGKIVVYNYPYKGYGNGVQFRFWGAVRAAELGAVASLIRSVSPIGFDLPHTGMMRYVDTIPKIPHAAITMEDAALLQRFQDRGIVPKIKLMLDCQTSEDTISYNLIAEYRGSSLPDEYIAMGGHSDSWDNTDGAHDDASGCIAPWYAIKSIMELGYRPARTMRLVWWVNEENGVRGGKSYAEQHKHEKHRVVFEFDSGVFEPTAIGISGDDKMVAILKGIEPIIKEISPLFEVRKGGGGVDIGPMMQLGVPGMSLSTKGQDEYFWYHHSRSDTPEKVDPMILNKCIAVIAVATYIYADLPEFISTH